MHTRPRGAFNRLMQELGREDLVAEGGGSLLGMMMEPEVADELWDFLRRL